MTLTSSASFAPALAAAREAASPQHYPEGTLYVVATPIGNLADITLRALHVLALADMVACEDTRHTRQLLNMYGIGHAGTPLLAVHKHNEAETATVVVDRLRQGGRVAYVSDAGTPAVSDPGARLVALVREAGLRVVPLPGASSITTALSAAGAVQEGGFVFAGFLPTKPAERARAVQQLAAEARTTIVLEAPHRMASLSSALAALDGRSVTLARELTKQFEDIVTLPASDLPAWLAGDPHRQRGEFVVVIHGVPATQETGDPLRILRLLLAELPLKTAVRLAADITGHPRNALYDTALALKQDEDRAP